MSAGIAAEGVGYLHGYGSRAYRKYVLNALLLIYILNFVDRGLLSVVAPELKPELGISDTAFGLLTGFGFALLYTVVGIPLAQFAETRHRVGIMAVCILLWSLMTMLCGLAADITVGGIVIGGFWVLLACRIGVGIGAGAGEGNRTLSYVAESLGLISIIEPSWWLVEFLRRAT